MLDSGDDFHDDDGDDGEPEKCESGREAADALHECARGGAGWYAGATDDPFRRIEEHQVDLEVDDNHFVTQCIDEAEAREGARILREEHGYAGDGEESGAFVYVYRVTEKTDQSP